MKINNIQEYNLTYNYKNQTVKKQKDKPHTVCEYNNIITNPVYYVPFCGGYSLNLSKTIQQLDKLAEKLMAEQKLELYPKNMREWLGLFIEKAGNEKKTLIDAHKEYFENLKNYSSLGKIKEHFPEFNDVVSVYDVKISENKESFITKFLKGETEYFDNDEDLTVQLIKLYWGEGFSLNDLKRYSDGCDLYYTMRKLNIPIASRDYGHILKFSDAEYNERLTREMAEKRLAALDKKAQEQGGHIYIPRGHLTEEHKKHISEGLRKFYEENQDRIYEMRENEKKFLIEHDEQTSKLFSRVVKKAWEYEGGQYIRKLLKNYLGSEFDVTTNPALWTEDQSKIMKRFWAENEKARKIFSKSMKSAWKKVKEENETYYIIQPYPRTLLNFVEARAGIEKDSLDVATRFNPYIGESLLNTKFEEIFNKNTDIDGIADTLADTYQIAVFDLVSKLKDVRKSNSKKPFNKLCQNANEILALNTLGPKNYKCQTTAEARNDFLHLAVQAAKSENPKLIEMVDDSLERAFLFVVKKRADKRIDPFSQMIAEYLNNLNNLH